MIDIKAAVEEYLKNQIYISPHPLNRASEAGHPCLRFLVLSRTKNELRKMTDLELQKIFSEGNFQEDAVLSILRSSGIKVDQQQRAFEWKKFELSGHVDGFIVDGENRWPLEIKSISPNGFIEVSGFSDFHDLLQSKKPWVRKYPAQLLLYMMMAGKEQGVMVFKDKTKVDIHQINFQFDDMALEYTESILKKLEEVNAHVKAGTCPGAKWIEECPDCPFFGTACLPDVDFGQGLEVMDNAELEEKLKRWEETAEAAAEHEKLDKEIKEAVRGKNVVVGNYLIESKEFSRKNYNIPPEIKKQYEEQTTYFVTKIRKI